MTITEEQATATRADTCLACGGTRLPNTDAVVHGPDCDHAGGLGQAAGDERCSGLCARVLEAGEPYVLTAVDRIAPGPGVGDRLRGDRRGEITCLPCAALTPEAR